MSEAKHKVEIAACYGASNTGQLAGAVATELAMENEGYSIKQDVLDRIAAWSEARTAS